MPHEDTETSRTPALYQCIPGARGHRGHEARKALASVLTAPILDATPNKKEQVKYPGLGFISIGG